MRRDAQQDVLARLFPIHGLHERLVSFARLQPLCKLSEDPKVVAAAMGGITLDIHASVIVHYWLLVNHKAKSVQLYCVTYDSTQRPAKVTYRAVFPRVAAKQFDYVHSLMDVIEARDSNGLDVGNGERVRMPALVVKATRQALREHGLQRATQASHSYVCLGSSIELQAIIAGFAAEAGLKLNNAQLEGFALRLSGARLNYYQLIDAVAKFFNFRAPNPQLDALTARTVIALAALNSLDNLAEQKLIRSLTSFWYAK